MSRPLPISNVPLNSFAQVPNGGLVVPPDGTLNAHRDLIVALAARYRLPAVYPYRHFVAAGGLMSYAIDYVKHLTCEAECLW